MEFLREFEPIEKQRLDEVLNNKKINKRVGAFDSRNTNVKHLVT